MLEYCGWRPSYLIQSNSCPSALLRARFCGTTTINISLVGPQTWPSLWTRQLHEYSDSPEIFSEEADLNQQGPCLANEVFSRCDGSTVFASGDLHSPSRRITKSFFTSGPTRPRPKEQDSVVFLRRLMQPFCFCSTRDFPRVTSSSFLFPISVRHSFPGGLWTVHARRPIQHSRFYLTARTGRLRHHTRYHTQRSTEMFYPTLRKSRSSLLHSILLRNKGSKCKSISRQESISLSHRAERRHSTPSIALFWPPRTCADIGTLPSKKMLQGLFYPGRYTFYATFHWNLLYETSSTMYGTLTVLYKATFTEEWRVTLSFRPAAGQPWILKAEQRQLSKRAESRKTTHSSIFFIGLQLKSTAEKRWQSRKQLRHSARHFLSFHSLQLKK